MLASFANASQTRCYHSSTQLLRKKYKLPKGLLKAPIVESDPKKVPFFVNSPVSAIETCPSTGLSLLPKGSIVYHGTTLRFLDAIRQEGLLPASPTYTHQYYRSPAFVYVTGKPSIAAMFACKPILEEPISSTDQAAHAMVPILIEIEVKESCPIGFDHDHFIAGQGILSGLLSDVNDGRGFYEALHHDSELSDISWSKFQSAGIVRSIPPSWINAVFAPRFQQRKDGSKMLLTDMHFLMQACIDRMILPTSSDSRNPFTLVQPDTHIDHIVPLSFNADDFRALIIDSTDTNKALSTPSAQLLTRLQQRANGDMELLTMLCLKESYKGANIDISDAFHRIQSRF